MIFRTVHNKEDAKGLFTELISNSRMSEPRFCVYVHKDSEGVVRYVGEGTEERAKQLNRPREKAHCTFFHNTAPVLEFIARNLTKSDAQALEVDIRNLHVGTIFNNPHATKKAKPINISEALSSVKYDTGSPTFLTWINKPTPNSAIKIGSPAGYFHKSSGYCYIGMFNEIYAIHRIVWALHNGDIPEGMIVDHLDNDRTNNNILNLRLCTYSENVRNSKKRTTTNSGFKFIYKYKTGKGYSLSWTEENDPVRYHKKFSSSKLGSEELALQAAISFRQTLVDAGKISLKINSDGEQ